MFSRIAGTFVESTQEGILVDAGGLGYDVFLPGCVAEKITAKRGDPVHLEIYSVLNIDGNAGRFTYYGFTNPVERAFFEALLSVSSIGPKSAARAFSQPMSRIALAIDRGDHNYLKTLPGIGQQKARDIVAKLQGKVARFLLIQEADVPPTTKEKKQAMPEFAEEAIDVLVQLEYKRPEAQAMVQQTLSGNGAIDDAEKLLTEIYRQRAASVASAGGAEERTP